ncbi:MAG TPA: hypothetical protein VFN37_04060 [Candidatus Baltobacteraceae bacterium]|nr:hypothetical protein [Candidatus Baltobacteraceae bacterium]
MLTELQGWFAEQLPNRRLYPRRRGPFRAWLRDGDAWRPLVGIDISASGVGVMSLAPLPWGAVEFAAEVLERRIEFRGQSVWLQEGTLEEKRVWRGGFRTGSVNAEGWRAILDFCNTSLPPEQHVTEPPLVRVPPDDAERLIPHSLRDRIVELLAQSNRLVVLGAHPNLQFTYGGVVHRGERLLHKLVVASSAIDSSDSRVHLYQTAFHFNDELDEVSMEGSGE